MIYQFLYARKSAGYCQINDDGIPFSKNGLLKIESLKSYYIAENINTEDLPHAYYYYNETIDDQKVGILGKTTFVPAGTSEESGSRNTSFSHKYILTDHEYENALKNPSDLFENRVFYETVEEYKQRGIQAYDQTIVGEEIDPLKIFNAFSLNADKLEGFIYCCLNAFSDYGRRVYCYLPSNDSQGSQYAKKLMQVILSVMPPSIISGVGFITYASTYHNAMTNPIPGTVSVIFIPDNEVNRLQAKNEKERNYIFDFKNYVSPLKGVINSFVKKAIQEMITKMQGMAINSTKFDLGNFYMDLEKAVIPFCSLDGNFLGAYGLLWELWEQIKINYTAVQKMPENYQLTWDDSVKIQARFYTMFQSIGLRKTLTVSVQDVLKYQGVLTQYGLVRVSNIVSIILAAADYEKEDLEMIDMIYSGGELCKHTIIQRLCEQCLLIVQNNQDNEKIFTITNYLYQNEDINDLIVNTIYENSHYYPVAKKLIETTLAPLVKNETLAIEKKIDKIFSSVKSFYGQYPILVLDVSFKDEIHNAVEGIMSTSSSYENANYLKNTIFSLESVLVDAYMFISQEVCYRLISLTKGSNIMRLTNSQVEELYKWEQDLDLHNYESTLKPGLNFSPLKELDELVSYYKYEKLFSTGDIYRINEELELRTQIERIEICKRFYTNIKNLIDQYKGDESKKEDFYELFGYIYCCGYPIIMERIITKILNIDGITALHTLNDNVESLMFSNMLTTSRIKMEEAVKTYLAYNNKKNILSKSDEYFLEYLNIPYPTKISEAERSVEKSKHKHSILKNKDVDTKVNEDEYNQLWERQDDIGVISRKQKSILEDSNEGDSEDSKKSGFWGGFFNKQ